MALALTLKPQERMILGDAVIRNMSRHSAHLLVETPVPVLRNRDILPQNEARTPCGHLYLAVQLLYLQPAKQTQLQDLYLTLAQEVLSAAPSLSPVLQDLSLLVAGGDYYRALQVAKRLLGQEQALLQQASGSGV
jgi:flagellar protein FlbT